MEEQAEASLKDYFVEVRKVSGQLGRSVPTTVDLR